MEMVEIGERYDEIWSKEFEASRSARTRPHSIEVRVNAVTIDGYYDGLLKITMARIGTTSNDLPIAASVRELTVEETQKLIVVLTEALYFIQQQGQKQKGEK